MSSFSPFFQNLRTCFREFCSQTSIQGLNHIVAPGRHYVERVLWAATVALGIYGAFGISKDQWMRYEDNPTVVTLEKDFRNWKYSFPAITVCMTNKSDPQKVATVVKKFWNIERNSSKYKYYAKFVDTVANSNLTSLQGFLEYTGDESLEVDLFIVAKEVLPNLSSKVKWSGLPHNWTRTATELGLCHTTNSIALNDISIDKLPNETSLNLMTCQYSSKNCIVTIETFSEITVHVHSPYDIPDWNDLLSPMEPKIRRMVELGVIETTSGPGVQKLGAKRRRCKYNDEPTETMYKAYSTSLCRRACRNRWAIALCGCKPFYNFYDIGQPCSTKGMACLSKHEAELRARTVCPCVAQCEDALYKEISVSERSLKFSTFTKSGTLIYTLQPPRTRYTRVIVFNFQDLVVSFGGAIGLFIGASFLSFIEIIYFSVEKLYKILGKHKNEDNEVIKVAPPKISYERDCINQLTEILEKGNINNFNRRYF